MCLHGLNRRKAHPEVQPARHGRIDRIVLSLLGLESGESHILVEEGLFKCAVMLVRLELDSLPAPGAPSSVLAPSSDARTLPLVALPGAPSVLAPSSDARSL